MASRKEHDRKRIARCLKASDGAVQTIRETDYARRYTALEVRETQIAVDEDHRQMGALLESFESQMRKEHDEHRKWIHRKHDEAEAMAEHALQSVLLVADVQDIERKIDAMGAAVLRANRLYQEYAAELDTRELLADVEHVVREAERRETDALRGIQTDEVSLETAFRAAIEHLYGLSSRNPKVMEGAKRLAAELRPFCNAAANRNFHEMVARESCSAQEQKSGGSTCSSSTEHTFSSSLCSSVDDSECSVDRLLSQALLSNGASRVGSLESI